MQLVGLDAWHCSTGQSSKVKVNLQSIIHPLVKRTINHRHGSRAHSGRKKQRNEAKVAEDDYFTQCSPNPTYRYVQFHPPAQIQLTLHPIPISLPWTLDIIIMITVTFLHAVSLNHFRHKNNTHKMSYKPLERKKKTRYIGSFQLVTLMLMIRKVKTRIIHAIG